MRPTCQSDTQLHANALYFEAASLQKCAVEFYKLQCTKSKLFFMLISFVQVSVTPHIAYCRIALTGSNEVNSDLSVL